MTMKTIRELAKAALERDTRALMEHITALTERLAEAERLAFECAVKAGMAEERADRAERWYSEAQAKIREMCAAGEGEK